MSESSPIQTDYAGYREPPARGGFDDRPDLGDVHTSHCCTLHGCKYGDRDCTVVDKGVPQEYPCHYCTEYLDEFVGDLLSTIRTLKFLAEHPEWYRATDASDYLTHIRTEVS